MNKKKQNLQTTIIFILVIALVVAYAKINSLESDIRMLKRDLANNVSSLEDRVNSIYGNVDEFLKQEASLLAGVEYEYGELDPESKKVDIQLNLIPKQISEEMVVKISFDDTTVELTRNGNAFEGAIPVGLFVEDEHPLMTIVTPEGEQTQYLEDVFITHMFPQYIPTFYHCDISGEMTFHSTGQYVIDGTLNINCSPSEETPNANFVRYTLITALNGQEIEREDITQDVLGFETYPDGVYFRDGYQKTYDVKQGDELIIYLEAEDSLGYIHRCMLHIWKQQNGAVAESTYAGEVIYDSEGNALYGKQFG